VSTARVDFTRGAAERIARVVRAVEQGSRDEFPLRFGSVPVQSGGKVFRVCTFTGAWLTNASKIVTFRGVTSTPNTALALNLFAEITGSTSTTTLFSCAIAKEGTAWYLIAAQCPNFS
jgi:hypothetical protein